MASNFNNYDNVTNKMRYERGGVGNTTETTLAGMQTAVSENIRMPANYHDTATAGTTTQVTLPTTASNVNDFYNGMMLEPTEGAALGEISEITDYDGTTRICTVSFTTAPGAVDVKIRDKLDKDSLEVTSGFVDKAGGDFRLSDTSLLLNAGLGGINIGADPYGAGVSSAVAVNVDTKLSLRLGLGL